MPLKKRLLLTCVCLTLAACGGVDPNSPLGKRQTAFKEMLKVSEDLGGMLRGRIPYDESAFITGAGKLERLSREPWQHFPQVRDDERSKANPEVWQRQEQFQSMARDLEQATAALVQAATTPPLRRSELEPAMQTIEDSCEACHKAFRAY
ncbi:c-type cytochrome [Pseudomonas sp. 8O]|uniref:c-type cytochrome n=1 Tax=Pseudomonas sp. 8O TaxID=2653165 RepID=UPI0012F16A49|nr:cytochrome c [Pseudomonas sp. 8O]VXB01655.1 Cytochrome C [Pseudomonas sp. 8O]